MIKQSAYKSVATDENEENIPVHGKYSRPIVDETLKAVNDLRKQGIVAGAYATDNRIEETKRIKKVPLYSITGELVFSFLLLGVAALIGWFFYGDMLTTLGELPVLPILGFWCFVSKRKIILGMHIS